MFGSAPGLWFARVCLKAVGMGGGRGGKPSTGKEIKRENRNMIMKPLSVWDCGDSFLFLKQVAMKPLWHSVSQTLFFCVT